MHRNATARLFMGAPAASLGITFALYLVGPPALPFFLASLGSSAIFLFGLMRAPAVHPVLVSVPYRSFRPFLAIAQRHE